MMDTKEESKLHNECTTFSFSSSYGHHISQSVNFCKICGGYDPLLISIYYLSTKRCQGNDLDIAKCGPDFFFIAIDWAAANLQT